MAAMTKRVNINAPVPVRNIKPPIYGKCDNIIMTTGDILKCLCKRAVVDEILPNGSTVRLTMKNYYTDNGAGLDAKNIPEAVLNNTVVNDEINATENAVVNNNILESDDGTEPIVSEPITESVIDETVDNITDTIITDNEIIEEVSVDEENNSVEDDVAEETTIATIDMDNSTSITVAVTENDHYNNSIASSTTNVENSEFVTETTTTYNKNNNGNKKRKN